MLAWFLVTLAASYAIPPETTGRARLKQEAKKIGVEIALIPDAAWDELVARNIEAAKFTARLGRLGERNWRGNLVQNLHNEAIIVAELMSGARSDIYQPTLATLVKFGVLISEERLG